MPLDSESLGKAAGELRRSDLGFVQIGDRTANAANEMVMRLEFWIQAHGTVVQTDLPEQPRVEKRLDVFVNGPERDRGDPFTDDNINRLGRGMVMGGQKGLVDDMPLLGEREPVMF